MKLSKSIIALGIGSILLLGGLFAIYVGYYGQSFSPPPLPVSVPTNATASAVAPKPESVGTPASGQPAQGHGLPVSISVPDANINIGVAPGYYNPQTKKWTLGSNSAFFAMASAKPNDKSGNTYIYGHYRASVFSRLSKVHEGSFVTLKTDSGTTYTYKYNHRLVVDPNDSTVLSFDGAPRLTLQTCSGAFFQNRSLYVFDLVGVSRA